MVKLWIMLSLRQILHPLKVNDNIIRQKELSFSVLPYGTLSTNGELKELDASMNNIIADISLLIIQNLPNKEYLSFLCTRLFDLQGPLYLHGDLLSAPQVPDVLFRQRLTGL